MPTESPTPDEDYLVLQVEQLEDYAFKWGILTKYRLVVNDGEVVYHSRGKGKPAPEVGETIFGHLLPSDSSSEVILQASRRKKGSKPKPDYSAIAEKVIELEAVVGDLRHEIYDLKQAMKMVKVESQAQVRDEVTTFGR